MINLEEIRENDIEKWGPMQDAFIARMRAGFGGTVAEVPSAGGDAGGDDGGGDDDE